MDSPLNNLLDTILPNLIQSNDLRKQQEIIDEYFTEDCTFNHPWMKLQSRQEVKQLYELWFRQNKNLVLEVNRTAFDPQSLSLFVDLTQKYTNTYRGKGSIRVISILHLRREIRLERTIPSAIPLTQTLQKRRNQKQQGARGEEEASGGDVSGFREVPVFRICCQEDFYPTDSIVEPFLGSWWKYPGLIATRLAMRGLGIWNAYGLLWIQLMLETVVNPLVPCWMFRLLKFVF